MIPCINAELSQAMLGQQLYPAYSQSSGIIYDDTIYAPQNLGHALLL